MAVSLLLSAAALLLVGSTQAAFQGSTASSYAIPSSKMGIDDQNYILLNSLDQSMMNQRNLKLQSDISPSVHRYNVFWSSFEASGAPSSNSPISCASGYVQVPADASGLKANGGKYNKYRCMSYGLQVLYQTLLQEDAAIGWESAAIIWCAPIYARDPSCAGQPEVATESAPDNYTDTYANFTNLQNSISQAVSDTLPTLIEPPIVLENSTADGGVATESAFDSSGCSCVPADAFMPDFQDYIAYLGDQVNSGTARWSHYIIWNECANSYWTDISPRIDVTQPVTAEGQQTWVNTYANMIKLTQAVVQQPALVYVSTDRWWGVPPVLTQWNIGRAHMGTENLLLGLWQALGLETEWSLVLHVYGGIDSHEMNGENGIVNAYAWPTVNIVRDWQNAQLASAIAANPGTPYTMDNAPQRILAASEQGWQASEADDTTRGKYLCQGFSYAHEVNELAWVSWFDFQLGPSADDWSLVPGHIDADLDNAMSSATYAAQAAANPSKWGVDASNWCCVNAQVGCP